jgi:PleD family two-component response regulator
MDNKTREILVVDDDQSMRDLLVDILVMEGFNVRSAANGEQALQSVVKNRPHLILLDINMPEMDGVEVLKRLKAQDEYLDIPVILVSGTSRKDEVKDAFSLGAADFIAKPYKNNELLSRVRYYIGKIG